MAPPRTCLGMQVDRTEHLAGSARETAIREQRHLVAVGLEVGQCRHELVQFRHTIARRALARQHHHRIPVHFASFIGCQQCLLVRKTRAGASMHQFSSGTEEVLTMALPRLPSSR